MFPQQFFHVRANGETSTKKCYRINSSATSIPPFARTLLWLIERFHLSVAKPKAKQLLWLITTDINVAMNQSQLEANACSRCQARENA